MFEFATAGRIVFGRGVLKEAAAIAKSFGQRAFVVTGKNSQRAAPLVDSLRKTGISVTPFAIEGEPTTECASEGAQEARKCAAEMVISFGGGSVIDAGKAIAALATNPDELLDYLEVIGKAKPLQQTPLPFVAIPTTAGTGAEVTRNAVLASKAQRVKVSLRSPLMLPRVAIVDPELTYSLSPEITAATGLDALTQLIEPYVSARANPLTDALCVKGMKRAARSLRIVYKDGSNADAREDMCVASLFGGMALANAGLGAVHGFAAPIGGMFDAPHGAVCAALLPHAMELNIRAVRQRGQPDTLCRFDDVARLLTGNATTQADDGVNCVRQLCADLQIPALRTYGIDRTHVEELCTKAAVASSMKANPIKLTTEELRVMLQRAL